MDAYNDLVQWLEGVAIIGGEGEIDLGARGPVYVAVVHDGSSYTPGAAIVVDQNPYHNLENAVLETAFEIMEDEIMKDEEHVKEIQEEWGDRWNEILTEAFDGKAWRLTPEAAAQAIRTNKRAAELISIVEAEES